MSTSKPDLTITIPEPRCWIDFDPREPEVYIPSSEPQEYCPLCKHWNSGPNVKSTISPQKYFPTSDAYYGDAPAPAIDQEQLDKDLAEQLRRAAIIASALDGEIARLEAVVRSLQPENI
jgi:hypothetical protein